MLTRVEAVVVALAALGCGSDAASSPCGYRCGPAGACPADYSCHRDGRCHLNSAPPDLSCALDGGIDAVDREPFVVGVSPAEDELNVATDVTIRALFDEAVTGVDNTTFTLRRRNGSTFVPAKVTYDPVQHITWLDPLEPLMEGSVYLAAIQGGTIRDVSGMPAQPMYWEFTTVPDLASPTVALTKPANGATGVSVTAPIIASFSEQVMGVTQSSFFVTGPAGPISGQIGYVSQTTVRVYPGTLAPLTAYTVTLTSAIQDFGGNPILLAPITWTFMTGPDTVPPEIIACNPCGGEQIVPGQLLVVQFSEPMIGVSAASITIDQAGVAVPATVSWVSGTNAIQLAPTEPLAHGTTYRLTITPAITDASGNPVVPAVLSWTFTTSS